MTNFDTEPSFVQAYAWSRDGRKIAITRARYLSPMNDEWASVRRASGLYIWQIELPFHEFVNSKGCEDYRNALLFGFG
jgi:hypothetical protein